MHFRPQASSAQPPRRCPAPPCSPPLATRSAEWRGRGLLPLALDSEPLCSVPTELPERSRHRRECAGFTTRKGHHYTGAFLFCDLPKLPRPSKSANLTQCRNQHYFLQRVIPCHFGFPATRRKFVTRVVSRHPDLGQEIPVSVAMENQLGSF